MQMRKSKCKMLNLLAQSQGVDLLGRLIVRNPSLLKIEVKTQGRGTRSLMQQNHETCWTQKGKGKREKGARATFSLFPSLFTD